jgi:integrase
MAKSNKKPDLQKPHPDFPLFPHKGTNRWAKKIRGKRHYFGHVLPDDPKGEKALQLWLDQKDDLLAGRTPRVSGDGLTVDDLCNKYLTSKYHKLQASELSPRSLADCKMATDRIVQVFGKKRLVDDLAAEDFAELRRDIAKTRNPESVGNEINRIRGVFKYGTDNHLIERTVRYGSEFKRPARRVLRKVRNERERKVLEAAEICQMIDAANVQLRAMILLGVNCGLGNSDVANLPTTAVNLGSGWLDFPRPKTGIARR